MSKSIRAVFACVVLSFTLTGLAADVKAKFVVGGEMIEIEKVNLPYVFKTPGVTLYDTVGGHRFVLSGATIGNGGIQGNVSYTVELAANTENNIIITGEAEKSKSLERVAGLFCEESLKIVGPGSLNIVNSADYGHDAIGIRAWGGMKIIMGASVVVNIKDGDAIEVGGKDSMLSIEDSSVSTHSEIRNGLVAAHDINGALASGTKGTVHIIGSIVLDSSCGGINANQFLEISYSHCTFVNKDYCIKLKHADTLYIDQSVINAFAQEGDAIYFGSGVGYFGEGEYKIATHGGNAINASYQDVYIDGADMKLCAPGGRAINCGTCEVLGGSVKVAPSMDVRNDFAYGAFIPAVLGAGGSFRSIAGGNAFYLSALNSMVELVRNRFLDNPSGAPEYGIYVSGASARINISGGTVICDCATKQDLHAYLGVDISGGSVKAREISPQHNGIGLACVKEKISGATEGAKITGGWKTILPSYYGTRSLYADDQGCLYFWIPEGSEGWGDDLPDIAFYEDEDYPLAFYAYKGDGADGACAAFEEGETINFWMLFANMNAGALEDRFYIRLECSNGASHDYYVDELQDGCYLGGGYELPDSFQNLPAGTYTLKCTLDSTNVYEEDNEANNSRTVVFTVGDGQGGSGRDASEIGTALGIPDLIWDALDPLYPWMDTYTWTVDTDWAWDGVSSVRSDARAFEDGEYCGMVIPVTGPKVMKFRYSKSFEAGQFSVEDEVGFLYRDDEPGQKTAWKQVSIEIPEGEHEIWLVVKPNTYRATEYQGVWLDDLQFVEYEVPDSVDIVFRDEPDGSSPFYLHRVGDTQTCETFRLGEEIWFRLDCGAAGYAMLPHEYNIRLKIDGKSVDPMASLFSQVSTWVWTAPALFEGYYNRFDRVLPKQFQNLPKGSYTLTCTLDATDDYAESNEANNSRSLSFTVAGLCKVVSATIVPGEKVEIDTGLVGYTASGLPSGLCYSKTTGLLTGAASKSGEYVVKFTKSGAAGEELTVVVTEGPEQPEDLDSPPSTDTAIVCEIAAEYRTKADVGVIPVEVVNVGELVKITVKGLPSGVKFTAKDVVDRKTKEVTVPANSIYGTPTKSGVYAATVTVTSTDRKSKIAPLAKTLTFVVRNAGEHVVRADCDAAQGSVKGMGVYAKGKKVTLKATAAKGWVFSGWYDGDALVSRLAAYVLTMPEKDVNLTARFISVAEDKGAIELKVDGVAYSGSSGGTPLPHDVVVKQGVYVEWPVAASALSATTVKVSGLPSGLKFAAKDVKATKTSAAVPANTIYGTPKTASKVDKNWNVTPSKVKITVTTAGKSKQEYVLNVTVRGIPAEGTFNGGGENGLVSLTVAKTGKISGKYLADGKTWTLSATGFDTWEDDDRMTAMLTAKSGKEVKTVGLTYEDGYVCASLASGQETGRASPIADAIAPLFEAWRNGWKAEPQKTLAKKLKDRKVQVGEVLLTVKANGAVTAKGAFVTGFDEKKQKDVTYSASCSTVLIPAESEGRYMVYLYFPPKAGKFDGFTGVVEIGLGND